MQSGRPGPESREECPLIPMGAITGTPPGNFCTNG